MFFLQDFMRNNCRVTMLQETTEKAPAFFETTTKNMGKKCAFSRGHYINGTQFWKKVILMGFPL